MAPRVVKQGWEVSIRKGRVGLEAVLNEIVTDEQKMQIEVWADIVCPWCGLGNHRFKEALSRFDHRDEVEVLHRSFQLDPSFPEDATRSVRSVLKDKYGMADEQIDKSHEHIEAIAAAEGLSPYVVGDNIMGNTALTHELLAFATDRGRGEEAWQRLFDAHFGEVRPVFDLESLVKLGTEIGLSEEGTRTVLSSRIYAQQVEDEAGIAKELGATGVPFFVFDRRYAVAGARSADEILEVIERAWTEYQIVSEAHKHAHAEDPNPTH